MAANEDGFTRDYSRALADRGINILLISDTFRGLEWTAFELMGMSLPNNSPHIKFHWPTKTKKKKKKRKLDCRSARKNYSSWVLESHPFLIQ